MEIKCTECGDLVVVSNKAHQQKYCKVCRKKVSNEFDRKYRALNKIINNEKKVVKCLDCNCDVSVLINTTQGTRCNDCKIIHKRNWAKNWRLKNPHRKEYDRIWKKKDYEKNSESILAKRKEYLKRTGKKKEWDRTYYDKNKCSIFAHNLHRYHNDIEFRLCATIRGRLHSFLKRKTETKTKGFNEYIGCTPNELKKYLEKQFEQGMSWKNHSISGWHIDHIIPLCSAKTMSDLYALCHYSNLQPLWSTDNQSKSGKLNWKKTGGELK